MRLVLGWQFRQRLPGAFGCSAAVGGSRADEAEGTEAPFSLGLEAMVWTLFVWSCRFAFEDAVTKPLRLDSTSPLFRGVCSEEGCGAPLCCWRGMARWWRVVEDVEVLQSVELWRMEVGDPANGVWRRIEVVSNAMEFRGAK